MSELATVLWITLIGVGLVFSAILVLWGLMVILVRLTGRGEEQSRENQERQLKQQAAAVAVALALAFEEQKREAADQGLPHEFPLPPTAVVSPWQAVTRSKMLDKRGPVR
jgi:Na+-transporting methylmalonyl-CoA/oxaloacetate decarboxylase gamma subunit